MNRRKGHIIIGPYILLLLWSHQALSDMDLQLQLHPRDIDPWKNLATAQYSIKIPRADPADAGDHM
jgi:hypothetical protein